MTFREGDIENGVSSLDPPPAQVADSALVEARPVHVADAISSPLVPKKYSCQDATQNPFGFAFSGRISHDQI